jgi:hypothetical protein
VRKGGKWRLGRLIAALLLVPAPAAAALAAPAAANTVLGSSLEDSYEATYGGAAITVYQEAAPSEVLIAPGGGTITSWEVRSGDLNAKYALRVIRPNGGEFTAAGTSATQTVPDSEDKVRGPFAVSLPVKSGDRIALDVIGGTGAPINNTAAPIGDELNYLQDPFPDGTTKKPALTGLGGGSQELLLQATFNAGPPVNTARPTITGEPRAGTALTGSVGNWENAVSFAFQWLRCSGSTCSPIPGATGASYTPTTADEGQQLRLDVTATGGGGEATASSELTAGVKAGPLPPPSAPVNLTPPVISGEARDTETLTGSNGTWAFVPSSFEYQWLRCQSATGAECAPVEGANSASYRATRADVGSTMRLQVRARNGAGYGAAVSAPTGIVQPLVLRAKLAVYPSNACVGTPVEIDASASQTPHPPITSYHFRDYQFFYEWDQGVYGGEAYYEFPGDPTNTGSELANGPSPRHTYTFTWDRTTGGYTPGSVEPGYVQAFDPILFVVTVTDASGAIAGGYAWLKPAQIFASESASGCPGAAHRRIPHAAIVLAARASVGSTAVTSTVSCLTAGACSGSISIIPAARPAFRLARAASTSARPPVIANNPHFRIAGHHKANVAARLTREGRALLRSGKPVKAIIRVTVMSGSGALTTRSVKVTLRRR